MEIIFELAKKYFKDNELNSLSNSIEHAKQFTYESTIYNFDMAISLSHILLDLKMDCNLICAGILYPSFHNSLDKESYLDKIKNKDVKNILESIDKVDNVNLSDREKQEANVKIMFIALAKDIRVIILKLAIEEYKTKNSNLFNEDEKEQLYQYVRDIYSPLSSMLGITLIKNELEDAILKYYKPKEYDELNKKVSKYYEKRTKQINYTIDRLNKELRPLIPDMEIYGRHKQLYSIYRIINEKHYDLSRIYDILAVRIIVDTVDECYLALGKVHAIYPPINHFKDYISNPKKNGYQSLHTTVIVENGDPLEIQIRTKEMHYYNEYGFAAHWAYKNKTTASSDSDKKINYIRSVLDMYKKKSSSELLDALKVDVYHGEIFVQSPMGKIVKLPEGSTAIDFAFSIHTKIGEQCVGVKINGKMRPLSTPLKNGDMVEIITNVNSKGPSRDWLNLAKTASAKSRINAYFKREMKEDNIKRGKSMLETYAKDHNVKLSSLMKDEYMKEVLERYALSSIDDMYASIGYNGINPSQIVNKLIKIDKSKRVVTPKLVISALPKNQGEIIVRGEDNLLTKFAQCCKPLPGDEIVGYISRGNGITIHRANCVALEHYEKERLIECEWNEESKGRFVGSVTIITTNNTGVLANITKKISDMKINIVGVNAKVMDNDKSTINISIEVSNNNDILDVVNKVKSLEHVIDAYRAK